MAATDFRLLTHPYSSPCGNLLLGAVDDSLCLCDWTCNEERRRQVDARIGRYLPTVMGVPSASVTFESGLSPVLECAVRQLDEYFDGRRRIFQLPLLLVGTPFQQSVWRALQTIPYGDTLSYAALAFQLRIPASVRAVATSNRNNPLSIIVPCHRVIGSNGALVGYAGGLEAKGFLLEMEKV